MTTLKLSPAYRHMNYKNQEPPATRLTPETAFDAYRKLFDFLAIERDSTCPAGGWEKNRPRRDLFQGNGFHHRVEWKPAIDEARYRRLSYEEFLIWYGILRGPNEKGKFDLVRPAEVSKVDRRAYHPGSPARCRKRIVGWIKRLVRRTPDPEA